MGSGPPVPIGAPEHCSEVEIMPLAVKADANPRRLGSRSPVEVARDLAALVGVALGIGLAVGVGTMLTVLLFA